ncbi:cytidine deaminase [Aequorivita soesokkakensis]|uniref:Cytidine deaminase n=1 Tax=Aequorivita soesokkakensis TaxID=1385699 RepID=A0A1A9LDH4_9FLAO|nr:cytidine deaminase [Aequorivita soesokkakensis]OAD91429.1 cytidine deaminase [Aequorivita soesokkakensis]
MKKQKIEIPLEVFEAVSELPIDIQELMNKAQQARENAYAPYSRFRVGAALQLSSGKIVLGNNQENAAFPSGLCAERVAVFNAGANFPNEIITALAITVRSENKKISEAIAPCGACRQSLAEYEQKQKSPIEIYFMGETGEIIKVASVMDLLPLGFDAKYL